VLTRWPIALEIPVAAEDLRPAGCPSRDALTRWFGLAAEAYTQRCPSLRDRLSDRGTALSVGALRVRSLRAVHVAETLRIAIATTELRPTSIEVALRVRVLGRDAGPVANCRCSLRFVSEGDGTPVVVPDVVRSELIRLEATASEYC
jgi:acyl-CoA thioesterase FadM